MDPKQLYLKALAKRDQQIIREFAKGILSKTSIGARFGVSRERVRQIVEADNARQK